MIGYHYSVSFTYSVHACFVLRRTNDVQLYVARSAEPGPAIPRSGQDEVSLPKLSIVLQVRAGWIESDQRSRHPPSWPCHTRLYHAFTIVV